MVLISETTPEHLLINVLREYKNYSDAEVKAAYSELSRRGSLENALELIREEMKREKSFSQQSVADDSTPEFYLSVYKSFRAGSREQVLFESKLIGMGIPYYSREGMNINEPMVHYYFTKVDLPVAERLEAETWDETHHPADNSNDNLDKGPSRAAIFVIVIAAIMAAIALIVHWLKK